MNRKRFLQLLATAAAAGPARPALVLSAAATAGPARSSQLPAAAQKPLKNWTWVRGDFGDLEPWRPRFAAWKAAGIDAILPNTGDAELLRRIVPVAAAAGLETHAWIFTMMRGGMEQEHPEWYAVNRAGDSTATAPPYVEYYKFLCPSRAPVRTYLAEHVRALTTVDGLTGIHLDYVRYPDVILPSALWETYGLVQDREHPEFDYCYCDECRRQFTVLSGVDPLAMIDPPANADWVRFRYATISRVVAELVAVARAGGKAISAAVFPTPMIARRLVRQDWPSWNLDAVLPMLYHSFYEEPVDWIEPATREGVRALAGRRPLYAGLYVPALDPEQLATAARHALAGGAAGIALFESQVPTPAHWRALSAVIHR